MIGVTEPRRVAAIAMSQWVAKELNLSTRSVNCFFISVCVCCAHVRVCVCVRAVCKHVRVQHMYGVIFVSKIFYIRNCVLASEN